MFLFFNVSEIKIEGVTLYEQDQILGVGGVSTGQNLVRTNTDIVEKRLKILLCILMMSRSQRNFRRHLL